MALRKLPGILLCCIALAACQAEPPPPPTLAPSAAPSATGMPPPSPTAPPTATRQPTRTPRPTRTPKPSPTLPTDDDFLCLPDEGERISGVVAGVVDGDTIRVQVGLQNFTVRYIGIDAPETNVQPPERMGPEATARNRELVTGKRVTLVSDPGVGNTDIYNRLLRYVLVENVFVNTVLVSEGLARYYASPNAACGNLVFAAENEARSNKVGLWMP